MLKRLVTVFLILCMGWQSLAFAGFGALVAHEEHAQHELLHFQGVAHHHDDHADGFHEDNSTASTVHGLSDACQYSGKLTVLQGGNKTEADIKEAGDNTLRVMGVKLGKGDKLVAALSDVGGKSMTVRFTIK